MRCVCFAPILTWKVLGTQTTHFLAGVVSVACFAYWALLHLNGSLTAPDLLLGRVQPMNLKSPAGIPLGRGSPDGSLALVFQAPIAVWSVFRPVCMAAANPLSPTFKASLLHGKTKNQGRAQD